GLFQIGTCRYVVHAQLETRIAKLTPKDGDQVEPFLAVALGVQEGNRQPLAVFDANAITARLPAELVEDANRGSAIRLPRAFERFVVTQDRGGQRCPSAGCGAEVDGLDRGIDIERQLERLANPRVVPGRAIDVQIQGIVVVQQLAFHQMEHGRATQLNQVLRWDEIYRTGLAILEHRHPRAFFRNVLERQPLEPSRTSVRRALRLPAVVWVSLQRDLGTRRQRFEFERARADRVQREGLAELLSGRRRNDAQTRFGEIGQKRRIRARKLDLHGEIINHFARLIGADVRERVVRALRLLDAVEIVFDGRGVEARAVVELHVVA